ncbi:MAG TPA: hypothetical protein VH439_17325 [Gemmatimonadales bacterium]
MPAGHRSLLFHSPEIVEALERIEAAPPDERLARIDVARHLIDVPGPGPELRAWIRWCLQRITNKATGRVWTQADIGREAGDASGATVSRVFMGELPRGELADKVRSVSARVLGLPIDVIWRPTLCPECGNPLPHGDHDTRTEGVSDRRGAVRWSPRSDRSGTARRPRGARKARSRAPAAGSVDGVAVPGNGVEPTDENDPAERGQQDDTGADDASEAASGEASETHDESGEAGSDPQTMT